MWPTVDVRGDVVVLAPELMAVGESERDHFIVGNVLRTPLTQIVRASEAAEYVQAFWRGAQACRSTCQYFSYCGGGHASNKYFESGSTEGTETDHCRYSTQYVLDAVIDVIEAQVPVSAEAESSCSTKTSMD
jgi:uncharacterized protein